MFDSSALPNVDDLGLKQPDEIAYAAQMAAHEHALHSIFGPTGSLDQILSPGAPNFSGATVLSPPCKYFDSRDNPWAKRAPCGSTEVFSLTASANC